MISGAHRVKKDSFPKFNNSGRSFFAGPITLRVIRTGDSSPVKIAVIVSKKVVKTAVRRNSLRRRIYSSVESSLPRIKPGFTILIYPKLEVLEVSFIKIQDFCTQSLKEANLFL